MPKVNGAIMVPLAAIRIADEADEVTASPGLLGGRSDVVWR